MPYMTGITDNIEKALFLRKFNVPFWAISYVFGKYPMHWFRMEQTLGRNSIVGTTIRKPEDIPKHLCADEKHTWIMGNKVYVSTTVGRGCILGAEIAEDAGEEALTSAYKVFKDECHDLESTYSPETVNIDGWKSTHNAWLHLFKSVNIIFCFLHIFIKIRDRGKKKYRDLFVQISSKLWECYRAANKGSFSQRIRRLLEACEKNDIPDVFVNPIKKLRKNIAYYRVAYDHPEAHRTSNMLDRLMQRMDRHLFSTQYFHGSLDAAKLSIRGWTLIQNFAPSNPRTIQKHNRHQSPAERLNNFQYHDNWLQNLLISASLGGYRMLP
jgi:transposase-like protein